MSRFLDLFHYFYLDSKILYSNRSVQFQNMIVLKTHPFVKFLGNKNWNNIYNYFTTITLKNPILGMRNITKGILDFFVPIFFGEKNTTGHSYFAINHKWHMYCIFSLLQLMNICLCKIAPRINKLT